MKKWLLLAATAFSLGSASAQVIQKGQRILGGGISLGGRSVRPDGNAPMNQQRDLGIFLSPSFGKATGNNRVFGYRLNFSHQYNRQESGSSSSTHRNGRAGVGVFRERFYPLSDRFAISLPLSADLNYLWNKSTNVYSPTTTQETKSRGYGLTLGVNPTLTWMVNKKTLLQLGTQDFAALFANRFREERTTTGQPDQEGKYTEYGFSSSLNRGNVLGTLNFSFRYIF